MAQHKHIVAIFVSMAERASELAAMLDPDRYDPQSVRSSDQLAELLNTQRVDVVIIENEHGGFLTGVEILERIYKDLLRPLTILLAKKTGEIAARANRIGIDAVLPPDAASAEVVRTVNELIPSYGKDWIFIRPRAKEMLQRSGNISPLPQVVIKVSSYLTDEHNVSMKDLANDVSVDAKITADLLKCVNSAAMGLPQRITNVWEAVKLLGLRRTCAIVLSSTVTQSVSRLCQEMPPADRMWYNRRSIIVASANFTFTKNLGTVSPDTAYVLGLFQELGIIVMAKALGAQYFAALRRVREVGPLRLEVVEESSFGVTHADVGGALLREWKVPPTLISPVLDHHRPQTFGEKSNVERSYLGFMEIAEAVANILDGHGPQRYPRLRELCDRYAKGRSAECTAALQEAVAKAKESSEIFETPIPDVEDLKALMKDMIQKLASPES